MQLLRLSVKNWVHHRELACEFTRGLIAILGENGSGKSSLFGAIRWALTGENPNFGVKADNISQYAKDGEAAYVTLEFEHNGHIAEVCRHLLPEKEPSVLCVDGAEVARGDKAVTAGIEKLLGVDAKFISRFIIVGQTDIFSFIDDNQTETDKFFQRLFNTTQADRCQDLIGKNLAKITIPEIVHSAAQLERECAVLSEQCADLDRQIRELPDFASFLAAQEKQQKVLQQWARRQHVETELQQLRQQHKDAQAQLARLTEELAQHQDNIKALAGATSGRADDYATAREALGRWQSYKSVTAAKEKLQTARKSLEQQRQAYPEPPSPENDLIKQLQVELAAARQELTSVNKFVATFRTAGTAQCPVCRTATAELQEPLTRAVTVEVPELTKKIADLEALLTTQQDILHVRKHWETLDVELRARDQQLQATEATLTVVPAPTQTEAELTQQVDEYEQFLQLKKEIEPVVISTQTKCERLNGTLAQLAEREEQLQAEYREIATTVADAEFATQTLAALQAAYARRQELEQRKNELSFQYNAVMDTMAETARLERQAANLRKWVHAAERTRTALKNAPRLVAQRNLQLLENSINELLQIFGVNFSVKVATDGTPSFIAEFFDGRRQVAQRLSIGQKTVLALAFRVAVNSMFADEIGLLALDEPTASLDAPRVKALAPVLAKLRELSTAKGLQCLLVTHATSLSHLFESTIELDPPEVRNVSHTRRDNN